MSPSRPQGTLIGGAAVVGTPEYEGASHRRYPEIGLLLKGVSRAHVYRITPHVCALDLAETEIALLNGAKEPITLIIHKNTDTVFGNEVPKLSSVSPCDIPFARHDILHEVANGMFPGRESRGPPRDLLLYAQVIVVIRVPRPDEYPNRARELPVYITINLGIVPHPLNDVPPPGVIRGQYRGPMYSRDFPGFIGIHGHGDGARSSTNRYFSKPEAG
ncbi:hypothetical protein ES703_39761 [subsurface metagenome]